MIQISFGGDRVTDINALSTDEVQRWQDELCAAALLVSRLGFDGVEIHFGHGFILCKLLDAAANQRTDHFGGSIEKRASILTDIIPDIRAGAPDHFILGVRMGAYLPDLETAQQTARHLEAAGVDLFDITFSVVHPDSVGPVPPDFPFSAVTYSGYLIKQAVSVPVIGVNRLDSEEKVRELLHNNYADIAGAATPILADYDFPNKIMTGEPVRTCRHCEQCFWFTDHTLCPAAAIHQLRHSRAE
jgi:2,4-dienoyl-CoA reductase-like NADH-dependent reductase (Old Yellow Enzyme family)